MEDKPIHGGNIGWAAQQIGCSAALILDFSASINPLGPPESALEAIEKNWESVKSYPDPNYKDLREVLGESHNLPWHWVLPGNGAAELLNWACWDLSQQALTYLIAPSFNDYQRGLKAFGGAFLACVMGLQPTSLGKLSLPLPTPIPEHTGLLLNNPHNPTGQLWKTSEIVPLLEQFSLVVVDEAFMDFLPPSEQESLIPWVKEYPNLVVIRSLTKLYSLPGLRLGYAIAHPERLKKWESLRPPWSINSLAVAAGKAIVKDINFQEKTWNWLKPTRSHLSEQISHIPSLEPLPGAANFLLVKTGYSSIQLQQDLLKQAQILIRDCSTFPELGNEYFRIAVRTQEENQKLIEALKQLVKEKGTGNGEQGTEKP